MSDSDTGPSPVVPHEARPPAEGLFSSAVDALAAGVLLVGLDGRITLANREIEREFGYRREDLLGQAVEMLIPEAAREIHEVHREHFAGNPSTRHMGARRDLFARRRDGSHFPVEIRLNALDTPQGVFVLTSVADLSSRRELEHAAHRAVEGRIDFERLVADLSIEFINLPSQQVDDAIRSALQRVGESLDLDRCTFFRIQPDGTLSDPIGWSRADVPRMPATIDAAKHFPWALENARAGRTICVNTLADVPNPVDRASYEALGTRSVVTVPLSVGGRVVGAVGFNMVRRERTWAQENLHRMRVIATAFGNVLARQQSDDALRKALADVERLRDQLQSENVYLRKEVRERLGSHTIVGQSPAIRRVLEQVRQVASTDSTVLLLGETGVGKELFATHIHELSARHARAMVRVNCSAIPATLMESELFGREKGAFTGALARQIGRFELADHSTIFLDEIGDLPPEVQVKLLRVLEERQIERLGSPKSIRVDVRVIAATHRDLEQRIADGAFRDDLFYRLNVFPIMVPPLRERVEDIPLLVARFVDEFSRTFGKRIEMIPRENMMALQRYAWPGNIRELRNVIERAMILATGPRLTIALPALTAAANRRSERLAEVEKEHIRAVLESTGWRVRGAGGAADRLGLKPTTLETRMAKLGLQRPRHG
ncbi:MAG TPA: sigma 54-interacting transcriptional regulator [Vicinamibacterales bacterium]|nr:sigma 54-interacting transcriptional regulator [Vicinamibacterales bacterium]